MKYKVLDTSCILYNWNVIKAYPKESIIVPYQVLQDLDKFKVSPGQIGINARQACNFICTYMNSGSKSKLKRVWRLQNGSSLCLWHPVDGQTDDQRILNTVKQVIQKVNKDNNESPKSVILISKKPSFRLMAHSQGLDSEDYNDVGSFRNNNGYFYIQLNDDQISLISNQPDSTLILDKFNNLPINSYVIPTYQKAISKGSIYRYIGNNTCTMINCKPHCCGILPKNVQQCMAIDALMNDDIPFVSLLAKAGTGKTLLAIASAMQKVLVQKKYRKIVITRPIVPIGRDIGYLPGDLDDKMEQWLLPFWNNIDYIASINYDKAKRKFSKEKIDMLLNKEKRAQILQILPISFMRGSSISNSYIIIDEAQNTTPSQMKTIITRIGQNSKLVLTGDIQQIDSQYLSKDCNGLTMAVNKFYNQQLFSYIQLKNSERSKLSKLANEILF